MNSVSKKEKKTARKTLHTALSEHSSAYLRQRFDRMSLQMTFCPSALRGSPRPNPFVCGSLSLW